MSRADRVSEAIRKEVSLILHDKFKDPRLGFITITRVELAADLRNAKVFYSVLGKEEDYKKTKAALDSGLGLIRKLVSERINLRIAPEIIFREDRSSEYSVRIEEILNEINGLNKPARAKKQKADEEAGKEAQSEPAKKSSRVRKKA
jgi:ribosome-binding factor A